MLDGIALCHVLHIGAKPILRFYPVADCVILFLGGGAVVQIRRIPGRGCRAVLPDLHKMNVLGNRSAGAIFQDHAVLNGILDIEQDAGILAVILVVDQNRAALHYVNIALPHQINDGFQQRMSGADKLCLHLTGNPAILLIKADTLVTV